MKTKFYNLLMSLAAIPVFSQVGINTTTPQSTLDVNGNVIIRQVPTGSSVSGYQVLAINQSNSEISSLDPALLSGGSGTASNSTVYAAKKASGNVTLLSLGLFPSGFRAVNFVNSERTIGSSALFSDTDNTYTVPSTGVYAIGFYFRYGTGLQAALLANSPGVGIVRTRAGVATLIDSRSFTGANLILLSLTISESSVNSLYPLQAGDKISFGLTGSSLLDASILSTSTSSFYIYKISD
ncbi:MULTISPECIES: hypothetical protein [Chryseobacterium]|uniref:C1q domain-containing protein n=1 Tax=Chryseobacterium camelliae TaxID=1265445 RepID=A0ABU0THN6_9FLAO|nr:MULTISPECIES: hypothetical protein [Chryseobacterium]MDT3406544.1 hypothetical protein [Pseudacidovorax intermedius]MDQ1095658.1 hypothetical protein [Chryseobacterium camelliae]MDQ1099595.1 hypothetical protein [Chryseobacterium sp. SORGH_AS_1048]MDR6086943.1 hypothetical protein [Chryseobacterium sp. SORGH_AS_0909]MDR6131315.1 hypothetical protein [Chryseobacterium sp. SORGH_AS_1175]